MPENEISNALQKCYTQNHSDVSAQACREAFFCCFADDKTAYNFCNRINDFLGKINFRSQTSFLELSTNNELKIIEDKINEIKQIGFHSIAKGFYFLLIVSKDFFSKITRVQKIDNSLFECMIIYDSENDLKEDETEDLPDIRIWKVLDWDIEPCIILLNHAVYNETLLSFRINKYKKNTYILKSTVYCINYERVCERVLAHISFHLNDREYEDEEIIKKLDIEYHQKCIMESIALESIYPIIGLEKTIEELDCTTEKNIVDRIATALRCQVQFTSERSIEDILQHMYGKSGDRSVPDSFLKKLLDSSAEPSIRSICDQYIRNKELLNLDKLQQEFPLLYLCKGLINWLQNKRRDEENLVKKAKAELEQVLQQKFKYTSPVTIRSILDGLDSYFVAYRKVIECSIRENYMSVLITILNDKKGELNERIQSLTQYRIQINSLGLKHTWRTKLNSEKNTNVSRYAFDECSIVLTINNTVIDARYYVHDVEEAADKIISENTNNAIIDVYPAICIFYNKEMNINIDHIFKRLTPKDFRLVPVSYLSTSVIKTLKIYTC